MDEKSVIVYVQFKLRLRAFDEVFWRKFWQQRVLFSQKSPEYLSYH